MPADTATFIRPFPEQLPRERWAEPGCLGLGLMLNAAEKEADKRRFIIAVRSKHNLGGSNKAIECIPKKVLDRLNKDGTVVYTNPEFPGVPVELHLMTEIKSGPGGKLAVLALHPTPKLLELIHEREVSNLVVVPWLEADIEDWRNKQFPEPLDLPENAP
jgi:hypothetical protein